MIDEIEIEQIGSISDYKDWVRCACIVDEPFNLIISGGDDKKLRIHCLKTLTAKKVIDDHDGYIFEVVQYKSETFLTACIDKKVRCYSLRDDFKLLKTVDCTSLMIKELRILDDDRLLVFTNSSFGIISYEKGTFEQILTGIGANDFVRIRASLKNPDKVFITEYPIVSSFSIKKKERIEKLELHILNVYSLEVFTDHKTKHEILAVGCQTENGNLLLYDTETKKSRNLFPLGSTLYGGLEVKTITSLIHFQHRYMFCLAYGVFFVVDLRTPEYKQIGKGIKMHESNLASGITYGSIDGNTCKVVTCSNAKSISVARIRGLQVFDNYSSQAKTDEIERKEFLLCEEELYDADKNCQKFVVKFVRKSSEYCIHKVFF